MWLSTIEGRSIKDGGWDVYLSKAEEVAELEALESDFGFKSWNSLLDRQVVDRRDEDAESSWIRWQHRVRVQRRLREGAES